MNQRSIFIVILVITFAPLLLLPSIFTFQSSFYPLLITLIFLGALFSLSSDHIVLKFNTVHNRFECIFDSDARNSKMYCISLSQLAKIEIAKTQNISIGKKISLVEKLTSKSKASIYLKFNFDSNLNFNIGPINGTKIADLSVLHSELQVFFEKNKYPTKITEALNSETEVDE